MARWGFEPATKRIQSSNNTAWDNENGDLILRSHLLLQLPTAIFSSGFPTNMYWYPIIPMRVTYLNDQNRTISTLLTNSYNDTLYITNRTLYSVTLWWEDTSVQQQCQLCGTSQREGHLDVQERALCCPWPVKHFILLARPKTWMSLTHHRHSQ
jgi:hypothetical protein